MTLIVLAGHWRDSPSRSTPAGEDESKRLLQDDANATQHASGTVYVYVRECERLRVDPSVVRRPEQLFYEVLNGV